MKDVDNIGQKIRQAMKEAGLTQQKLADKLGITNPVVNVWVTGKRSPRYENLKKIAEATNKPLNYFFGNSGNIATGNGAINVQNTTDNARLALLEKDVEILKKDIEILKLKINKG